MHILIVTHYFEPDSGAAAVRLSRLARLLQARGHQITVLTTLPHFPVGQIKEGYRGKLFHIEDRDGIRVIRSWLWATPSKKISRRLISQNTFMLTAAIRGMGLQKPDVVLVEAQPIFTGLAGRWISAIKGAPFVLNISDLWPDHLLSIGVISETHLIYRAARRLVDNTYHASSHIVAMSQGWADRIADYIGRDEKISVIHNGVDLERLRPHIDDRDFRAQYGLGDKKLVSFIGTFATQYDIDGMLEVTRAFVNREDVLFVFIGAGTQGADLKMRMEQGEFPNVSMIDWIDHADIPAAWSATHIAFWTMHKHPLYDGTIPAKLYETLACGVPVCAAHGIEGARMVADSDCGVIVAPADIAGLIHAIADLIDDESRLAHYAKSARAYAENHLSAQIVAEKYEQILIQAANRKKL